MGDESDEAAARLDRITEKWGGALSTLAQIEAAERRGYERGVREAAAVCAEALGCYPKALLALLDDEREGE